MRDSRERYVRAVIGNGAEPRRLFIQENAKLSANWLSERLLTLAARKRDMKSTVL